MEERKKRKEGRKVRGNEGINKLVNEKGKRVRKERGKERMKERMEGEMEEKKGRKVKDIKKLKEGRKRGMK